MIGMTIKKYILKRQVLLRMNLCKTYPFNNNINVRHARHPSHWNSKFAVKLRSNKNFKGTEFDEND